jgi:RecB family exonuclease
MNIEHISVSRSKSFKQCEQYYKFKYHLKIPNPGEEPFYFVYGKMIHKIAETYVHEGAARSLGEVSSDVLRGKIEIEKGKLAPPIPADYKRRMPDHLRAIQKITQQMGTTGVLEYQFRYDLDPPNGKMVTGFIDRLIIKGDKAWILDYKTTKKGPFRETKETIKHDPQLRCYARVVQREFNIPASNIMCALYYLEGGGELLPIAYNDEALQNVEKELLACYNEIFETNPDQVRGRTGQHCTRCEYKNMCPFFQTGNKAAIWDGSMEQIAWHTV